MSPSIAQHLVYGPVPSRRLGRSLGVDLVPLKTCTYDCVYCQLGRTTRKTVRRQRGADPDAVVAQVRDRLSSKPDVIALAGSGEPTLHAGIGAVIDGVKAITDVPVAVITNGSLISRPAVRRGLAAADIVLPSLDAPDEGLFQQVNRPHASLRLADVVAGMAAFRESYAGEIWLEVMLLASLTDPVPEVRALAELAARIAPDRIQLNTAVRPPAESFAAPVDKTTLEELAALFTPHAEVVVDLPASDGGGVAVAADVLELLSRRPCTVADIATGLAMHHGEALKAATALVNEGVADVYTHEGRSFYVVTTIAAPRREEEER
ncbi:MAG: radical SAM protein [Actinobacteria bacterium]|nr:radical SAM protein [Actinomycetota bacterium]